MADARYEVYLRWRPEALAGSDASQARMELLEALMAAGRQTGPAVYTIEREAGAIVAALVPPDEAAWREAGSADPGAWGVDVSLPGGASSALAEAFCTIVFGWVEVHGLTAYDPQLGRAVERSSAAQIQARVRAQASYLQETVGFVDDPGVAARWDAEGPSPGLSWRTKFYLGLAAILIALAVAAHYC